MKRYKIGITASILVFVITFLPQTKAYAGSINGSEQALLGSLSGTFTYEGRTYKATEAALAAARARLSADSVDMTPEQAAKAQSMISSYIPTAIQGGYLVPVDGGASSNDTDKNNTDKNDINNNKTDSTEKDNNKTDSNKQDGNKTDNNKQENDKTDNNKTDNNKKDPSKDVTTVTDGYDKTYSSNKTDTDKNNQASKDSPTTVEQYLEGTVEITNGEEVIFNGELPVKNTGFTIKKGLHIAAVLGVILVMVIAASCKYILFAKKQDGHNE